MTILCPLCLAKNQHTIILYGDKMCFKHEQELWMKKAIAEDDDNLLTVDRVLSENGFHSRK